MYYLYSLIFGCFFFFFFQAEDGIRDGTVTGVQTCALPISPTTPSARSPRGGAPPGHGSTRRDRERRGRRRRDPGARGPGRGGGGEVRARRGERSDGSAGNGARVRALREASRHGGVRPRAP